MDRRKFLKVLSGTAVVAVASPVIALAPGPLSDTEFLQGLLDKGGTVNIPPGDYIIDAPLRIKETFTWVQGNNSVFRAATKDCLFSIEAPDVGITNCRLVNAEVGVGYNPGRFKEMKIPKYAVKVDGGWSWAA